MYYLGIDIGIINLAIVKCHVEHFKLVNVVEAHRINMKTLPHHHVPRDQCTLEHSNDVYDGVQHVLQEYPTLFADIDQVRIERQPIGGLLHVEQLLFGHFRSKAQLVSPNAMHKYFGINKCTYDQRKEQTTRIATPYLSHFWTQEDRIHDLADALCILLYSLHKEEQTYLVSKQAHRLERLKRQAQDQYRRSEFSDSSRTPEQSDFLEQFRYRPVVSTKAWLTRS